MPFGFQGMVWKLANYSGPVGQTQPTGSVYQLNFIGTQPYALMYMSPVTALPGPRQSGVVLTTWPTRPEVFIQLFTKFAKCQGSGDCPTLTLLQFAIEMACHRARKKMHLIYIMSGIGSPLTSSLHAIFFFLMQ